MQYWVQSFYAEMPILFPLCYFVSTCSLNMHSSQMYGAACCVSYRCLGGCTITTCLTCSSLVSSGLRASLHTRHPPHHSWGTRCGAGHATETRYTMDKRHLHHAGHAAQNDTQCMKHVFRVASCHYPSHSRALPSKAMGLTESPR